MLNLLRRYVLLPVCFAVVTTCSYATEVLHVGAALSLTGEYSEFGSMAEKAYRLWERDVNRKGGILGKPVKVTIFDDKSDPQLAKELYQSLIVHYLVDLVLGPYSSEITSAVTSVTEHHRFPLLASGAAADSLWRADHKYLFGIFVTSKKYTVGFLELLAVSGINRIAIVAGNDLFSRDIEAATRKWANRFQLEVVFSERYRSGSAGIEESIRAAQRSGAEALMVAGHFHDSVDARRALKKIGWNPKAFYATNGPALDRYAEAVSARYANGTFTTSQWEAVFPYPGAREFALSFYETHGMAPSFHAASAYAAGQILEAAIRKTKSFDREKIRKALYDLDTITIIGRYGVEPNGKQVRHFTTTVQWQNGKRETVAPTELTTANPLWR